MPIATIRAIRSAVFSIAGLSCLIFASLPIYAQENAACSQATIDTSRQHYFSGEFDAGISLLEECDGARQLPEAIRSSGYELLSQLYFASNLEDTARDTICQLLALVPGYAPSGDESIGFRSLVEEVRDSGFCAPPEQPFVAQIGLTRASRELLVGNETITPRADGGYEIGYRLSDRAGFESYAVSLLSRQISDTDSLVLLPLQSVIGDVGPDVSASPANKVIHWNGWIAEGLEPGPVDLVLSVEPGRQTSTKRTPWRLIGGVVAAVATGAAACLTGLVCGGGGGGGGSTAGPFPPGPPTN